MVGIPEIEQGNKVGPDIFKTGVHLVGMGSLFHGPFPGVLNRQSRCNNRNVVNATLFPCLNNHSGYFRVHRHPGHQTPFVCKKNGPISPYNGA